VEVTSIISDKVAQQQSANTRSCTLRLLLQIKTYITYIRFPDLEHLGENSDISRTSEMSSIISGCSVNTNILATKIGALHKGHETQNYLLENSSNDFN
jgi:hypothetical protein